VSAFVIGNNLRKIKRVDRIKKLLFGPGRDILKEIEWVSKTLAPDD